MPRTASSEILDEANGQIEEPCAGLQLDIVALDPRTYNVTCRKHDLRF